MYKLFFFEFILQILFILLNAFGFAVLLSTGRVVAVRILFVARFR